MGKGILNAGRKELKYATVYEASNDEYTQHKAFNFQNLQQSKNHSITKNANGQYDIELDKYAEDYNEMFLHKGSIISPDEILEYSRKTSMLVPVKHRDEFVGTTLPSPDMTRVLHYYASKKVSGTPNKRGLRAFDETALLALGLFVDQLVDSVVDEEAGRLCLEEPDGSCETESDSTGGSSSGNESDSRDESNDDSTSDLE
ncbi:uncharacterized protein KQ657_004083 [Scheffersomyces spartinae]|uniref:Uncharacterized protein n=1 Tax=Scheffersomyces spartinae TaxID=45513 RepID=A0A9P8AKB5_9ASCO|nr:uncharacterized protein KQ657_004083 [Scheffersomyces spartinae]KAG7194972.1 hypothetical protein KQ657_004083 [Scheffersomyces spartinae]